MGLFCFYKIFDKIMTTTTTMKKLDKIYFVYSLSALVLITALALLFWFGYDFFSSKISSMAIVKSGGEGKQAEDCSYRRILDGVCVKTPSLVNPQLVVVMIENHFEARPQSGLAEASVVYEAPVEANYTRFLVIYPANAEVKKIGPVRSVRPYYLDWIAEYGTPMYMHCGGSPDALNLIKQRDIFDLNEFYRGWYYWRDESRAAPHNVYTSSELWNKALGVYANDSYLNDVYEGWSFVTSTLNHSTTQPPDHIKSGVGSSGGEVVKWSGGQITVSFLPPIYEAVWKYNSSTNQFDRYQMGSRHCDADGKCISADNVIVMNVDKKVLDEIGRLQVTTIGQGEAIVFKNGIDYLGTWNKSGTDSRTRFYDVNGEEIKLNPGRIWIEVVPQDGEVKQL